jgi:hypothetical protein
MIFKNVALAFWIWLGEPRMTEGAFPRHKVRPLSWIQTVKTEVALWKNGNTVYSPPLCGGRLSVSTFGGVGYQSFVYWSTNFNYLWLTNSKNLTDFDRLRLYISPPSREAHVLLHDKCIENRNQFSVSAFGGVSFQSPSMTESVFSIFCLLKNRLWPTPLMRGLTLTEYW